MADVVTYAKQATEGGHWYDRHGNQIETVASADGKRQIKPDIRHARKLDLAPGVTTIIGCAARPDLEIWKQRQAIYAALTLPRGASETEPEWLARVEIDMKETAKKAAEEGTRIHAAVQSYITDGKMDVNYERHVNGVMACLYETFGDLPWRSEQPVVSLRGYATRVDITAPGVILDFKSKDGDLSELQKLKPYEAYEMQLAATEAAKREQCLCGILFTSRTHPGASCIAMVERPKLERGLGMFNSLLSYWQIKNNHRPSWAAEAGGVL